MAERISLNGAWQFKGYIGEDWRWRDAHKPDTRDTRAWHTGTVPGSVHHDLWQAGEIPNPYFEQNSLLIEWIPARTWLYKRTFFIDEELRGKRIQLRFEGVDYEAEFFLNGESIGHHRGMYTPAVFEVGDHLHYGADNLIAVVIQPAPHEQPQVGRTSLVRTHKSRMTYWWDFCPRMIHVGIWDRVDLVVTDAVRIENIRIRPELSADFSKADVFLTIELDQEPAVSRWVEFDAALRLNGEIIAAEQRAFDFDLPNTASNFIITLDQPRLWYPNRQGKQPLYEAEIRVSANGVLSDIRIVQFGIRKIELIPNENADPSALPYTFVVNGRKTYINGWNWVPMDVMYGVERPEKLAHLLRLAQEAHVNLLRVWGGGLIEKEAFYDRCDELGIMVWQEFIQSSSGIENAPPDDPDFIAMMEAEAREIIKRKRNHPSLAVWCGGNELQAGSEQPSDDSHPLLAALKNVVTLLDRDRIWLPTSPSGRVFSYSLENIELDPSALHDVHGPWEYQGVKEHYDLYNRGSSLLHSEFGVEGITNLKTLNATIAPEHQQPVSLDNPYWHHLGAWWVKRPMWDAVFGKIDDIETLVNVTQYMQGEGLRYALEADGRRRFQNSGTLPWQFNEPYPMAACTSAVDYYGQPKPVYYAVKQAYEPVHVSAKFPMVAWAGEREFNAEIWVSNSRERAYPNGNLWVQLLGVDGQPYTKQDARVNIEANRVGMIASVQFPIEALNDVFFLDLALDDDEDLFSSRGRYTFTRTANLAPLLELPTTELRIEKRAFDEEDALLLMVTNVGQSAAINIVVEDAHPVRTAGYAIFNRNYFCLMPEEAEVILITWRGVPPDQRVLRVKGWNTPEVTLK